MENNQQQNAARILDMDLFNSIPHGEIFGTGYCYEPRLYANTDPKDGSIIPTLLRWVAKKGGGND